MSSNLPRVTHKIFAENAAPENIGQFGSALAGSPNTTSDIAEIQALPAWGEGWAGAVISERDYPALEEMTGVQKVASQQIGYIFQKGIPEWDVQTTYYTNSFCQVSGVIYKSLTDGNLGNNPTTSETNWTPLELGNSGAGQPIGSLFWSFAAADYVPDYALACDGTEYSSAMFTGLWNSYLTADVPKLLTKNYTQYQADITAYGSCAAFGVEHSISAVHSGTTITEVAVTTATWENKVSDVGEYVFSYDGTDWSLNSEVVTLADYGVILTGEAASGDTVTVTYAYGTHFKVPKINNTIYQGVTETVPVVGNGKTLGCTGINSSSTAVNFGTTYSAADGFNGRSDAYGANISYKNVSGDVGQLGNIGVTTDGEKSGLVAKLSDNVATITLRCFVVVANKSDNEAEFDWSQWASSLAGKANIDASNFSSEGKSLLSGLGMPSNKYIDLALGASDTTYTAPANGYYNIAMKFGNSYSSSSYLALSTTSLQIQHYPQSWCRVFVPVKKGDNLNLSYSGQLTVDIFRFIYAEGSKED